MNYLRGCNAHKSRLEGHCKQHLYKTYRNSKESFNTYLFVIGSLLGFFFRVLVGIIRVFRFGLADFRFVFVIRNVFLVIRLFVVNLLDVQGFRDLAQSSFKIGQRVACRNRGPLEVLGQLLEIVGIPLLVLLEGLDFIHNVLLGVLGQ